MSEKGGPGMRCDCSGLVSHAYPSIGDGTTAQYRNTSPMKFNEMMDGDLIFMRFNSDHDHVGTISGVQRDQDGNVDHFDVTHMSATRGAVTDPQEVKNGVVQPGDGSLRKRIQEIRTWHPETDPPRSSAQQ